MSHTPRLQERAYYENRYDSLIITQCRMSEDVHNSVLEKMLDGSDGSKTPEEIKRQWHIMKEMDLYFRRGTLAEKRDDRIIEWMNEDREADEFYERTTVDTPYCIYCNNKMEFFMKDLEGGYGKRKNRMLFFFKCKPCKFNRGIWDNGEEYKIEKNFCEKCRSEDVKTSLKKGEEYDIFQETCNECSHIKEQKWEHYKSRTKESDPNYAKDKERFILTEKGLTDFRDSCRMMKRFEELFPDDTKKEGGINEGKDDKIEKKLLDANDMKDLVAKGLKKFKYKDISFGNPSIYKKRVSIELNLFGRDLKKDEFIHHVEGILDNTNWKLLDKSIQIQLGVLACHIEGN